MAGQVIDSGDHVRSIKIFRSRPGGLKHGNFGDELTEALIGRVFGRTVKTVRMEEAELIGAGSILDIYWRHRQSASLTERAAEFVRRSVGRSSRFLHVWGSGAMLENSGIEWPQRPIYHSVRGQLTAARLYEAAPEVLGDPGILAPLLLDQNPVIDASVALVPHFVDETHVRSLDVPRHWKVIHTDRDVVATIHAIAASELVISSSLHGLITADAFGIPCIWARSHHDLFMKSDFKFNDHSTARGKELGPPRPYYDLVKLPTAELKLMATTASRDLKQWRDCILNAFPAELGAKP